MTIRDLQDELAAFAAAREWEPFHTPKNLVMALAGEVGELVEPFQWLTPEESQQLDPATRAHVRDELADVLSYLLRLADVLGIDLTDALRDKMQRNAERYPAPGA